MNAPMAISRAAVRVADLEDGALADRIDDFVQGHHDATPFHRPQWSAAVMAGTGNNSHYLLAEQGGAITGILPLTHVRSPLFGSALVSVGFAVGGGILTDDPQSALALSDAAEELARALRCPSIELRGGMLPPAWRRSQGVYAGFVRDLPAGEEAILKAIPRKQRAEVRKAQGNGLTLSIGRDLAAHYDVYAQSVRNLGTPVFPRRLFRAMLDAFGDDADILTVRQDGAPLAAVLSFYQDGTVYPFWGGGTGAARGARANELMYFELMKHASARGCTRFDFGRSKVGTGAFAFKKNWGFEPEPLVYAHWGKPRETNPLSPKYRLQVATWKKLPMWAARLVGPPIARGLG